MMSFCKDVFENTDSSKYQIILPLLTDFSQPDSAARPTYCDFIPLYQSDRGINLSISSKDNQESSEEATTPDHRLLYLDNIIADLNNKIFLLNAELEDTNFELSKKTNENLDLLKLIENNNITKFTQKTLSDIIDIICEKISFILVPPIFSSILKYSLDILNQELGQMISDSEQPIITIYGQEDNIDLFDEIQNYKLKLNRIYNDKSDLVVVIDDLVISTRLSQLTNIFKEKSENEQ